MPSRVHVQQTIQSRRLVVQKVLRHRSLARSRVVPRLGAVVDHDGQEQRAQAVRPDRSLLHRLLESEGPVFEDPPGHPRIRRGLELQQDDQRRQQRIAKVHPPQSVAGTSQETAGNHEVRRESPERREIEPASEVAEETAQELFHHPPVAEHALVGGIVLRRLVRPRCDRLSGHEPNRPKNAGRLHGGMGLSGRAELCGGAVTGGGVR